MLRSAEPGDVKAVRAGELPQHNGDLFRISKYLRNLISEEFAQELPILPLDFFGLRIDVTGRCDPHVDFLFAGHEADERSGVSFEAAELGHAFLEEFQAPASPPRPRWMAPVERGELGWREVRTCPPRFS